MKGVFCLHTPLNRQRLALQSLLRLCACSLYSECMFFVCLHLSHDHKMLLTVFTVQRAFRVQLGLDMETESSTVFSFFFSSLYLSFSLNELTDRSSVWISAQCFPIRRNACFPSPDNKMVSDRISASPLSAIMATTQLNRHKKTNRMVNLQ